MEKELYLKAYRSEIEVVSLTIDVPEYEGEKKTWYYRYEDVLLKLFNNKREDKDILEIINYYGSNKITIEVNLTHYLEDGYRNDNREETIEHLKTWLTSNLDISNEQVETNFYKGYIYEVGEYDNKIPYVENDKSVRTYIRWGE